MEEKITEDLIKELMENKDETRGVDFKSDEDFILRKKGKEGLKKVEKEMERLGYPLDYDQISIWKFYPTGLRTLSLLVIKNVFGMTEKEIEQMGEEAPKFSWFIRILMRYFFSIERFVKEVPRMWRKYHTTGNLEVIDYDLEKKFAILELKEHEILPLYCSHYLLGYFIGTCKMVMNVKKVTGEETRCPFKGDKFHQYILRW